MKGRQRPPKGQRGSQAVQHDWGRRSYQGHQLNHSPNRKMPGKQKRHRRTSVIPGEALSIRGGLPAPSLWSGQRGASVRGRGAAAGRSPRRAGSPSPTWSRCHVAQAPRRQGAVPAAGGLRHQPVGHLCASQGASPSHGRCPRRPALCRLARGGRELRAWGVSLRPARLAPSPGRAPLIFCQEGRRQSPPSSRPAHAWALPPLTVAPRLRPFFRTALTLLGCVHALPERGGGGWRGSPPGGVFHRDLTHAVAVEDAERACGAIRTHRFCGRRGRRRGLRAGPREARGGAEAGGPQPPRASCARASQARW